LDDGDVVGGEDSHVGGVHVLGVGGGVSAGERTVGVVLIGRCGGRDDGGREKGQEHGDGAHSDSYLIRRYRVSVSIVLEFECYVVWR